MEVGVGGARLDVAWASRPLSRERPAPANGAGRMPALRPTPALPLAQRPVLRPF